MISQYVMLVLLFIAHYIGDFLLQTDKMAINKSSSNKWLTKHVLTYMLPFILLYGVYTMYLIVTSGAQYDKGLGLLIIVKFLLTLAINFGLHWVTDYLTSRVAASYHAEGNRSAFFKTIGFDQMVHALSLITVHYLIWL